MRLRNQYTTRRQFFHTKPKVLNLFFEEFTKEYFLPTDPMPMFIMIDEKVVGFIRFKALKEDKNLDVSIMIDKASRKQGYAKEALIKRFKMKDLKRSKIIAEIKKGNKASIGLFKSIKFKYKGDKDHYVEETEELVKVSVFEKKI